MGPKPKKGGGKPKSPEEVLDDAELKSIEDNMSTNPCIVCDDPHREKDGKAHAWVCPKAHMLGPVSPLCWIAKNITNKAKWTYARTYVANLQTRGAIPSRELPSTYTASAANTDDRTVKSDNDHPVEETSVNDKNEETANDEGEDADTEPQITETEKKQAIQELEKSRQQSDAFLKLPQYPTYTQQGSCRNIKDAIHTKVTTNYYKIDIDANTKFYQYEISGLPLGQNRKKSKKLVDSMIDHVRFLKDNKSHFATDSISTIISWKKFPGAEDIGDEIGPYEVPDGQKRDGTESTRSLYLKYIRTIDFANLRQYVSGNEPDPHLWDSSVEVKALNMLIAKSLDDKQVVRIGPNKFFIIRREEWLSQSLSTIHGYFYTIKPLRGGVLLNVNYGTSAFYCPQLVSEFLGDNRTFPDETSRWAALNALRVEIQYGRGQTPEARDKDMKDAEGRQKTIQGTSKLISLKDLIFKKKADDGTEYNKKVLDYFKERYKHEFDETAGGLPGINLGTPRNKEWFSATKLKILPHQIYRRPVPDGLTDDMLKRAAKTPAEGVPLIEEVFDFLKIRGPVGSVSTPFVECPPLSITPVLLKVDSATLPYPSIIYNDNKKINLYNEFIKPQVNGETPRWTLMNCKFLESGPTQGAGVQVSLLRLKTHPSFEQSAEDFRLALQTNLLKYNIGGSGKTPTAKAIVKSIELANRTDEQLWEALRKAKLEFPEGRKRLIVLQLPTPDRFLYQSFKDMADREFGLQALCVTEDKIFHTPKTGPRTLKKVDQYLGNVMMKANLKFEGINHSAGDSWKNFKEPLQTKLKDRMLLGADVTHPNLSSIEGCPSIAAIVGSVDDHGGKCLGSMRLQNQERKDREIIQDVESMVVERLRAYWNYLVKPKNGPAAKSRSKLPKQIIYYRDGVSEGQFGKVIREEVSAIRSAFEKVKTEKKWKDNLQLTAIVVTKRHHTRFYPTREVDKEGKAENCKPGTVVDSVVTSPYFKEFFLQSHSGLQGTTKPAHYFVVEDDLDWNVADLASFTHQLSYTYVRATCGVSYAPPAYYADRLCERGRIYLRSFLSGDTDVRDVINKKKSEWEDHRRKIREAIFKPAKEAEKRVTGNWPTKTKDEEEMELLHKDQVMTLCKKEAMEEATKVWLKHAGTDGRKNPWDKGLDDTMFWM